MPTNIDDKELARLEVLAGKASKGPWNVDNAARTLWIGDGDERCEDVASAKTLFNVVDLHYIAAACNAVPALVAEVRRLREKVEAWEWWEEVRLYDPWSEHPCCTACGNRSKRGKIFDCAVDEYEKIKSAAWRAVHAD